MKNPQKKEAISEEITSSVLLQTQHHYTDAMKKSKSNVMQWRPAPAIKTSLGAIRGVICDVKRPTDDQLRNVLKEHELKLEEKDTQKVIGVINALLGLQTARTQWRIEEHFDRKPIRM